MVCICSPILNSLVVKKIELKLTINDYLDTFNITNETKTLGLDKALDNW